MTFDISLVYSLSGSNPTAIKLYGLYTHDELGTGQPSNKKRQSAMGIKLKNQSFK